MDPSQFNNNYQREHVFNRNEQNPTLSFSSLIPEWSSPVIGELINSIIRSNANNSALLSRSLISQNSSTLNTNLASQINITPHTNMAFGNNLVTQNIYAPQNNLIFQNIITSQNNLGSNNNLATENNLTSQNSLSSQTNLIPLYNFNSRNNVAFQNNFTFQNNLTSQTNFDSQTSSINSNDFISQHNNLSSQNKIIYFKDIITQCPLPLQYYNSSHNEIQNHNTRAVPYYNLTNLPPISSNIGQDVNSNNQFIVRAITPFQRIGQLHTSPNPEFNMCLNDFPQLPDLENANNNILSTTTKGNHQLKKNTVDKEEKSMNKKKMEDCIDIRDQMGKTNNTKRTITHPNTDIGAQKNVKAAINTEFETSVQTPTKKSTSKVICDQFGMGGLLSAINSASSNPELVELSLGKDLTQLIVDLNSTTDIIPTFDGPFTKFPIAPHNENINETPLEYKISDSIKLKLISENLSTYGDDMLLYLFYSFYRDELQLIAAKQLRERGWRFHTVLLVWISHIEGTFKQITEGYEKAMFNVFNPYEWKMVAREMTIDYSKLEGHGVKLTT